jgi:hypothetical protein
MVPLWSSQAYYLNKNLYLIWMTRENLLRITFFTKGLDYGSHLFILSHNQKHIGFYSFVENYKLFSYRFNPQNSTIPTSARNSNEDNLLLSVEDSNAHLMPNIPHLLQSDITLNTTILKKTFGIQNGSISIFMAFHSVKKSLNSTSFEESALINGDLLIENGPATFEFHNRLEFFHESTVAATIFFYVVLIVLSFIFSFFQPSKARGSSSYMSLIFILTNFLAKLVVYFDLETQSKCCSITMLFIHPTPAILGLIYGIYLLRLMVFQYINKRKIWFIEKKTDDSRRISFLIKLFTVVVHPITSALIIFGAYSLMVLIVVVILAFNSFQCSANAVLISFIISSVLAGCNFFLYFGCIAFDLIMNLELICKYNLRQLFKQDAYSLKLEFFINTFYLFPIFIAVIVTGSVQNQYFKTILNTFAFFSLTLVMGIIPVIRTIYHLIRSCIAKSKYSDSFELLFDDSDLKDAFYEFAKGEWSTENFECYSKIRDFYKEKNNQKRKEKIELIIKDHMSSNSPLEVNFSFPVKNAFKKRFKEESLKGEFSADLMDGLLRELKMNLGDTFSRFQISQNYENIMKTKKLMLNEGKGITDIKLNVFTSKQNDQ